MFHIDKSKYKLLFEIDSPEDLRKLPQSALPQVCNEVREYMIDTITQTGGHFGAGLGVVELTVALHYIYDTPRDKIVFDVGHQGYPHKILTGRRDLLHTIRQKGGISGFLKRSESEYDAFGAGHASTSISAALGLAAARDLKGQNNRVLALIGDGAMTGGLAFEAMNNCGFQKRNITVILNDNQISISPNVSAFSNYFNELFASPTVQMIRDGIWEMTGKMDQLGDRLRTLASRIEDGVKAIVTPGVLFEAFGFKYFGPINGHNILKLVKILKLIRDVNGPVFLHIITQKGKGYEPAEQDRHHLHAIGKIDKLTGKSLSTSTPVVSVPSYDRVFGNAMTELCKMNKNIVGITAAMLEGTGLDILAKEMPDRLFDVGIAEGHAVTFASGLAMEGMIPVVAIYSSFLQRAYDSLIHDCAIQNLHVVFALDRAGLVGADGATHHGALDLAYLRAVQNMTILAPKDEQELRDMLYSAVFLYTGGPVAIRYPRGSGTGVQISHFKALPYGKGEIVRSGEDIAILAIGKMVAEAEKAATLLYDSGISAEVVNARFIKPLDTELLDSIFSRFDTLITVEDGTVMGGFGSAVLEYHATAPVKCNKIILHGIPDKVIEHGTQEELLHELMLDAEGIAKKCKQALSGFDIEEHELAFKINN